MPRHPGQRGRRPGTPRGPGRCGLAERLWFGSAAWPTRHSARPLRDSAKPTWATRPSGDRSAVRRPPGQGRTAGLDCPDSGMAPARPGGRVRPGTIRRERSDIDSYRGRCFGEGARPAADSRLGLPQHKPLGGTASSNRPKVTAAAGTCRSSSRAPKCRCRVRSDGAHLDWSAGAGDAEEVSFGIGEVADDQTAR
jgi:hypothetical protein